MKVYFVATPIGNLGDISSRALETLRSVDGIFCEDTRHTLKLLNYFDIHKPLFACHKFNEKAAAEKLIEFVSEGKTAAVVTDAGTPVISDPGNVLAAALREKGIDYTLIPGACAFVAALVLSGFSAERFAFLGFLRGKNSEKKEYLKPFIDLPCTLLFYSAPQDVDDDIRLLYEVFGERKGCAVREITKIHESIEYFDLSERLSGEKRGEYVLVVEGGAKKENPLNLLSPQEHIRHYEGQGLGRKEALKAAAKDRGVSKSELYKFTLQDRDV